MAVNEGLTLEITHATSELGNRYTEYSTKFPECGIAHRAGSSETCLYIFAILQILP